MFDFNVNEKTRKVIRLRRASDNREKEFSIEDIENGKVTLWVNENRYYFSLLTIITLPAKTIKWVFRKINQKPPNGA